MNRFNKPWPHNPGVIVTVEENGVVTGYEARIFGVSREFPTYEAAAGWCVEQKDHAAELARGSYLPRDNAQAEAGVRLDAGVPSLADEFVA